MESFDLATFREVLQASGERSTVSFLHANPRALYWTFCSAAGHDRYLFFEFPLGSRFVADAVILNSYSGAWETYFIEFEPPNDKVFTRAGTPTKRLAAAARQLDDWHEYVEGNPDSVRRDLVRWAGKFDKLGYSDGKNPCNFSGDQLADPRSVILHHYAVMIGRSSEMSAENRRLVGRYPGRHHATIISYDRVLRLAERRYGTSKRRF